MNKFNLH